MQFKKTVPIVHRINCCYRSLGTFHLVPVEHRSEISATTNSKNYTEC